MSQIAIVIVNWNGKKDTLHCLASLEKLKVSKYKVAVTVVDNGSSDGSVDVIRKEFPHVYIIENNKNLGFTGGNNVGISHVLREGASYVWLLNNDTFVDAHALNEIVSSFNDQHVGIAGSKIYFAPGHEFHKDRYASHERGNVLWYAGGSIDWNNMYASHRGVDEVDKGQYNQVEETPFITGCSMMVKRNVFETVGMLDDRYYLYLEDVDFCLRAQRAGYKTLYVPSSKVWHMNASSSGGPGTILHEYYFTRNRLLLGFQFAPLRTRIALMREAIRFLFQGSSVKKKAVIDMIVGRFGRSHDANEN